MEKGLNLQSVKKENQSRILYLLNTYGELSRKEIAAKLSLTPAGITKICSELIGEGVIAERNAIEEQGKSGRREIPLSLCLDDKFVLGICADKDEITYSLSDLSGRLYSKEKRKFTDDIYEVLNTAQRFLSDVRKNRNIIGVGVSVIGSVDDSDFCVWNSAELKKLLESRLKLKTVIENNVKAFVQAELIYGKLDSDVSVLFFKWGPGLGSSIVADGKVYSGNDSGVTEIGHYIVDVGGKKCRCGRFGCLETVVSVEAINDEIAQNTDSRENIIDHKIDTVALALSNTATILNAQNIIFFGTMFDDEQIAEKLAKQCVRYNKNLGKEAIRSSALNSKSDYIGATAICTKKFFFERKVDNNE